MNDIKDLISNKGFLLDYLHKAVLSAEKNANGLRAMKERGFSQEGMLDKVIEVTAIQSEQIGKIAMVALFMVQGSDWDTKVAQVMNRMGRGREALQEMLKNKMKGV